MKNENKFSDLCLGLGFVILGAIVFILAGKLQNVARGLGPSGYPQVVAIMMIILGSSLALGNLIGGVPKPDFSIENPKGWLKILILLVVTFVYIWLLRSLGFLLLTPFYMGFLLKLFNHRDYKRIVAISLLTTIVLYLLFVKVFMIFLPSFRLF